MFFNFLLSKIHKYTEPFFYKSVVLKNLDWLIFLNIIALIITSTFLTSDNISYFAIFTIILTIIKIIVKPNEKFSLNLAEKFLLAYFMLVLISVAGSSLLVLSIKGFLKVLIYLSFYVSFVHFLKDNRSKLKYIYITLALCVVGESFIALKQHFLSVSEISGWQDMSRLNPEEIMTRVYGSIKPYNPNLFGGYILSILPTTLILFFLPFINKHYKTALLGFLSFILGIIILIMTGCRGAYLGLFVQILLLIFLTYRFLKPFYKKVFAMLSSIFIVVASFIALSVTSLRARIFSIFAMRSDSSNSFRFNVYNSCIEMFKDNWLLGIGVGNKNFREIYGLYMKTGFDALSAYNIYLETAVESGIFALITFICFIGINLCKAFLYIAKRKNITSFYLIIAIISIIGVLIHGFVDTVFFRPQIHFIFWIMMGVIRVLLTPRSIYAKKRA